jgi:NADH-quinone oxidoreductase subunit J
MTSLVGQTAFYYLAAVSVASAVLAITRRNPVHSMLWVLALFFHVAGIFLLVGAEFLAAVQVVVYAGAILVFYLFFLMLLDMPREIAGLRFGSHWPLAAAAGLAFAALSWYASESVIGQGGIARSLPPTRTAVGAPPGNLSSIGTALFTQFALPFEIVSLILLAAIVGAVVIAKRKIGA